MLDLAINNGIIIDPVDGKYSGSVGIKDGKITEIAADKLSAKKSIDAKGMIISPGFIDIHMHEDKPQNNCIKFEIFNSMALMGVTTAVGGNCGLGEADVAGYLEILDRQGSPVNYAGLIGHGVLREAVGCTDRWTAATNEQIKSMADIMRKSLERGALGVSFGLEYTPGTSTEEIMQLSGIVAEYPNKMISAHYRYSTKRSLEAITEFIIISRETGIKFQISHIGSCCAAGQMEQGLRMIEVARNAGVDVMADVYPYDSFSTFIGTPSLNEDFFLRWNVGYDAIGVASGKYKGQRCTREIFEELRKDAPDTRIIGYVMNESEVLEAMKHPLVIIASDGSMKNGVAHPRSAGTFPRVLGRYVRQRNDIDLVTAVAKITIMPARRLGLTGKGRIKEGYDADITIFDYDSIMDNATYDEPSKPPCGIDRVIVGGIDVVCDNMLTGNRPGKSLRF